MAVRTTAGSTFKVSATAPATYDAAGYAALTWTAVGEITDLGEFGREYTLVTHNPINTRITQKFKGSYNEGKMSLKLGLDTDDAGQVLMKAGSTSDAARFFEVTDQKGDKYYFPAMVMTWKVGLASVDSITAASCDLELTSSSGGVGVVESLAA